MKVEAGHAAGDYAAIPVSDYQPRRRRDGTAGDTQGSRGTPAPPFIVIPAALIQEFGKQLGAYGIAVYAGLASYAHNKTRIAFPAIGTLAGLLGFDDRTVRHWLNKLVAAGWVDRHPRHGRTDEFYLPRVRRERARDDSSHPMTLKSPHAEGGEGSHTMGAELDSVKETKEQKSSHRLSSGRSFSIRSHEVLGYFAKIYHREVGKPYPESRVRDLSKIENLPDEYSRTDLERAIDKYFQEQDPFYFERRGPSIGSFLDALSGINVRQRPKPSGLADFPLPPHLLSRLATRRTDEKTGAPGIGPSGALS